MHLAFLGAHNEGGFNLGRVTLTTAGVVHTAMDWRRADAATGNKHRVSVTTAGAPAEFTKDGGGTYDFGDAATDNYGYHYFSNAVGAILLPKAGGVQVGTGSSGTQLTVANVAVTINTTAHSTPLRATVYRSKATLTNSGGTATATLTTHAQVVNAEHAAFFFMYGDNLPAAEHAFYGAQTPLWMVNILRGANLKADYIIPHGAAQGLFWANQGAQGNFLYNRKPGTLHADFGNAVVTLTLAVGSVAPGGTYTEDFLKVNNLAMRIVGNTFNNYGCNANVTSNAYACGALDYADNTYDLNTDNAGTYVRMVAGGGFYGGAAQEVAGGIAHHLNFTSDNGLNARFLGGTRLQFIGANPTAAIEITRVTSAVPTRPALPTPTVPDGNITYTAASYIAAPVTTAPAPAATIRGLRHKAILGTATNAIVTVDRRERNNANDSIKVGNNLVYSITATLAAGGAEYTLGGFADNFAATNRTESLYETFPRVRRLVTTFSSDANRLFKFSPRAGGALNFVTDLFNYNRLSYTLDVTPADSVLRYGIRGAAASISRTAPIAAHWWVSGSASFLAVESDYAGYAIQVHSGSAPALIRYGVRAPDAITSAALQGVYHIPRHAAKGFYHHTAGAADSRFLSNETAGKLDADLAAGRGALNLTVHAYAATLYGNAQLANAASIPVTSFLVFKNFALSNFGNFGCASYLGNTTTPGSTHATNCGGTFSAPGVSGDTNNRAALSNGTLAVHAEFYGAQAQQIAGVVQYGKDGHRISLAFLGAHNEGGFRPPAHLAGGVMVHRALTWDRADGSAGNDYLITIGAGGVPLTFVTTYVSLRGNIPVTHSVAHEFGAAATGGYGYHYFHNTLGVILLPKAGGVQVGTVSSAQQTDRRRRGDHHGKRHGIQRKCLPRHGVRQLQRQHARAGGARRARRLLLPLWGEHPRRPARDLRRANAAVCD